MDSILPPSTDYEVTLSRSKAFRRPLEDAQSNSQPRTEDRGKYGHHICRHLHGKAGALGMRVLSSPQSLSPALRVPSFGIREWLSNRSASASLKAVGQRLEAQSELVGSLSDPKQPSCGSLKVFLKCPDLHKISLFAILQSIRAGGPIANVTTAAGILALQFVDYEAAHTFRSSCADGRFVVGQTVLQLADVDFEADTDIIMPRSRNYQARRILRLYTAAYVPRGVRQIYHTNLDIPKLQRIMGQIVEEPLAIIPMFQQHQIVFAVHFTSIAAAAQVYAAFAQHADLLSYYSCWKCQYERDPAERQPIP